MSRVKCVIRNLDYDRIVGENFLFEFGLYTCFQNE